MADFHFAQATSSIALLSYLNNNTSSVELSAVAGVVSGVAAAITAWQEYGGADRKINRYTNAIVALKNHMLWWDSLKTVDRNTRANTSRLVSVGEGIKLSEVHSWAVSRVFASHAAVTS